jgi:hypothetical protein
MLPIMGIALYDMWVWAHLVATVVVMVGLKLEDRSDSGNPEEFRAPSPMFYWAMGMQTGGHMVMFWVLFAFELSGVMRLIDAGTTGNQLLLYALFALSAYVLGCCLLAVQSMAKIFG